MNNTFSENVFATFADTFLKCFKIVSVLAGIKRMVHVRVFVKFRRRFHLRSLMLAVTGLRINCLVLSKHILNETLEIIPLLQHI